MNKESTERAARERGSDMSENVLEFIAKTHTSLLVCDICKVQIPSGDFYAGGHSSTYCKECVLNAARQYQRENRRLTALVERYRAALEQIIDETPEPDTPNECLGCTDNADIARTALKDEK